MKLNSKLMKVLASGGLMTSLFIPGFSLALNANAKADDRPNISVSTTAGERPGLLKKFFERAAIGTGTLTAKTGTTLTVTKDAKSFTVLTDDKTQFRRRFWGKSTLVEMNVGDMVTVIGKWTDDSHTTIQATLVRDLSIQKRKGVFMGKVLSLTANGWVMHTGRGDETVTVNSSTVFKNRKEQTISLSDVKVGDRVRVSGVWDKTLNQINEVTKVKDFSLPPAATPLATP